MTEKTYVVNVKTKIGTIFTVRADTAEELNTNILDVINNQVEGSVQALEELLTGTTAVTPPYEISSSAQFVADAFGGEIVSTTPIVSAPAFAPIAPPQTSTASAVGARMCSHGPMTARKGTGAKGEWKGLFCPTPKDTPGQCTPIWLNRSMPEWASV